MNRNDYSAIRASVRRHFAGIATGETTQLQAGPGGAPVPLPASEAAMLGYTAGEIEALPPGAYMGLGCGNPVAAAALQEGETVVDLGSGGGIDCFLASPIVGATGAVIGIDMAREMVYRAQANVSCSRFTNVEFILSLMEDLPLANRCADAVISNCTINLVPEKEAVFREAFRVLRGNGRFVFTDIVAIRRLPSSLRDDLNVYCGCVGGSITVRRMQRLLLDAGFGGLSIVMEPESAELIASWFPRSGFERYVRAALISAVKS